MVKNYLKIAFRNLVKQKAYSFINISGLAIGMACCILIMLYVQHELSYDRFHRHAGRIFRVAWFGDNPQTRTPHPLSRAMVKDFAEVESAVSLSPLWGPGLTRPKIPVSYLDKTFDEPGIFAADSTFFQVFSFPLIEGNPQTALKEPLGVVITEEIARKYFPNPDGSGYENPLGKRLKIGAGEGDEFHVSGVLQNIPVNSHFHFDFLISYVTLKYRETGDYYEWSDFGHYNYIRLAKNADPRIIEARIPKWITKYIEIPPDEINRMQLERVGLRLQPLTDIHLHSHIRWELEPNGNMAYVYIFTTSAFFILLLACINFVNLSTARSAVRAREVGMRKILGAFRTQLLRQLLGESMLLSILALILAVALVEVCLPAFQHLTGKSVPVNYLDNPPLIAGIAGIALFTGILGGIYPAFYLSRFQPIDILTNAPADGPKSGRFRKILVVIQFSIATALVIGTVMISDQLDYLRNKQLGFDAGQVLVIPIKDATLREKYEMVKSELLKSPDVLSASAVSNVPGSRFNQNPIHWEAGEEQIEASEVRVDQDFFKTMRIEFIAGRDFSRNMPSDLENAFIINEAAAERFTWQSPLNEQIVWEDDWNGPRRGPVIGVVKNFHFQSLHRAIEPLIFNILPEAFNFFLVRINSERIPEALAFIEQSWSDIAPGSLFEYSFLDKDFARLYRAEESMRSIFGAFTLLSLAVACLGLFGLASYMTERRTKEIGIRKALGASVISIVRLLSLEFLKLILIANLFAWPIAYLVMNNWLEEFPYRISIDWIPFFVSALLALLIAFLAVSSQAIKAATANPVNCLRHEP